MVAHFEEESGKKKIEEIDQMFSHFVWSPFEPLTRFVIHHV